MFSFLLFCSLLTFAASLNKIPIASFNLHGFKSSSAYLRSSITQHGGIWLCQELWLSEQQLSQINQIGAQFVAQSGMEDAMSNRIYRGRPFGGVCIAWSPHLNNAISPLSNFRHKRVVGIELRTSDNDYLILCAYMPFYDAANRARCMADTIDAISMLENIIDNHPNHKIILGGDFNTEFKGASPFDPHWNDFMTKFQLSCCDKEFPSDTFTYRHTTLDQKKWNDHFLVSESLLNNHSLGNFISMDDGDNQSDHLPIQMSLAADTRASSFTKRNDSVRQELKWAKLSDNLKAGYTERLQSLVNGLPAYVRHIECRESCCCDNMVCHAKLQIEYDMLINCLKCADSSLPRSKPGTEKDWWTSELTSLRYQSIEIHNMWKNEGRPRQGRTNEERMRVRAAYKRAMRLVQRAPKQAARDKMHSAMCDRDTNAFWRSWKSLYNKNSNDLAPIVNGCSSKADIAECFKNAFQQNSVPNNRKNVDELNNQFEIEYDLYLTAHNASCDCKQNYINPLNVIDALCSMKAGKSMDESQISAEHFHFAPLNFLLRVSSLFNMMLQHSFVPNDFRSGFMIPIVKDGRGNKADTGNYRGITISPIMSKLFEHVLKIVFEDCLSTSQYQFGFKRKNSTVQALHCLRETVNYYIDHGSRVFCSFLDASKAFDRLVHSGLFIKLMERKVPLQFLRIIMSWYDGLSCRVKWGDCFSGWFAISAGVRQGGVLSPDLYSIYVDELIQKLMALDKGCYFCKIFAAALFYADDMALLAPSIKGLQLLLNVCEAYCSKWDICLNAKKTKNLYFGKRSATLCKTLLDGKEIEWVDEWTYLGVSLKSGKTFGCSVSERVKKFYRCTNSIFRIDGHSDDLVMLRLLETHCVPLLTYAVEIVHVVNRDERRQLRVAYNSLFRKIFSYRWSESVTALQHFLSRPTWEELVENRKHGFVERLKTCPSDSLPFATLP